MSRPICQEYPGAVYDVMGRGIDRKPITKDDRDRRTKRTLENDTFTVYDYDNANQLTNLWHRKTGGGTTNTVSQYEYGYDNAGNRTWAKRSHQSDKGDVYSYDASDQLTGVKYNASSPDSSPSGWDREVLYYFDAAGNRPKTHLINAFQRVVIPSLRGIWPESWRPARFAVRRQTARSGFATLRMTDAVYVSVERLSAIRVTSHGLFLWKADRPLRLPEPCREPCPEPISKV